VYKTIQKIVFVSVLLLSGIVHANSNIKNPFNLNKLYSKNKSVASPYAPYNPILARRNCREIPHDAIWSNDSADPIPNPEPTAANCGEYNANIAYGCSVKDDNLGDKLKHFVVKINIPQEVGIMQCSGVVIDRLWVLTAAHCVEDNNKMNGALNPTLNEKDAFVQDNLDKSVHFAVKTVYIMADYDYFKSRVPSINRPYSAYIKEDLALMRLQDPLPEYYVPVSLARSPIVSSDFGELWLAGFGDDEKQGDDSLHFRNTYFLSNKYDAGWKSGVSGNYGEIYTVSTPPIMYKGSLSAWSLPGAGDSGGPVLKYDDRKQTFLVEGIHSGAMYCAYAGYFAKLPYPIEIHTSVPYYSDFINEVMNGSVLPSKIRCISASGGCKSSLYIVNQQNQSITSFNINIANGGIISQLSNVLTDIQPVTIKPSPNNLFAYVINRASNSITMYRFDKENKLEALSPKMVLAGSKPMDIAFNKNGQYAYVPNEGSDSISIFNALDNGQLVRKLEIFDSRHLNHPVLIKIINDDMYVLNSQNTNNPQGSISKYKIHPDSPSSLEYVGNYPTGANPTDIETDPLNQYVYVINNKDNTIWVYPIDNLTKHIVIDMAPGERPYKLAFVHTNYATSLYVINQGTDSIGIYNMNKADGGVQYVSSLPTGKTPLTISIDKTSRFVYVTNYLDNTVCIYLIRASDNRLSTDSIYTTGYGPASILLK
jgi:6-phosphogluconolactonase (cycloisomerase 2 family)